MNKIFVIDTENFSNYSFLDNYELDNKDKIVLFCSKNSARISFDDFDRLHTTKAKIEIKNVKVGESNALDFKIVTYITLNLNKKNEFYIVSGDSGYKAYQRYIKSEKDITVNIIHPELEKVERVEDLEEINEFIKRNDDKISKLIERNTTLVDFHNELSREFGPIGQKIYPLKKELFAEYHEILLDID